MEKKNHRLIAFLGGKTSYYVLGLICLFAITVLLLREVSFLYQPLMVLIGAILPPAIFALVLYYTLCPFVDFAESKKIPRTVSLIFAYLVLAALLVFGGFQLFPLISQQAVELFDQLPSLAQDFQKGLESFVANTPFADEFAQITNSLDSVTDSLVDFISDNWQDGARGLGTLVSTLSTVGITLVTGPIIAFFLIKSPHKFYQTFLSIIPPRFRRDTEEIITIANQQIGAFLKGQVIASLLLGLIYWPIFVLIGLRYATLIALVAGLLNIMPYIGAFVAFLPGLFVAFQDSGFMVLKFVIVWFAVQLLHGDLVIPRVLGNRLKIHPITIIVVLMVMGDLLGFVGIVLGIPIYSLIKLFAVYTFRKFKQRYNRYFGSEGTYEHTDFSEDDY